MDLTDEEVQLVELLGSLRDDLLERSSRFAASVLLGSTRLTGGGTLNSSASGTLRARARRMVVGSCAAAPARRSMFEMCWCRTPLRAARACWERPRLLA